VLTDTGWKQGHRRGGRCRGRQGVAGAGEAGGGTGRGRQGVAGAGEAGGGTGRGRQGDGLEYIDTFYSEATGRQYEKGELTELPYTFKRRKVHE